MSSQNKTYCVMTFDRYWWTWVFWFAHGLWKGNFNYKHLLLDPDDFRSTLMNLNILICPLFMEGNFNSKRLLLDLQKYYFDNFLSMYYVEFPRDIDYFCTWEHLTKVVTILMKLCTCMHKLDVYNETFYITFLISVSFEKNCGVYGATGYIHVLWLCFSPSAISIYVLLFF